MIDSHKHSAQIRAAVFGEPDFVAATVGLLCENGALPLIAATGSVCPKLREDLASEFEMLRGVHFGEDISVLDDGDFSAIERLCREKEVNLLIGSSDGRRIAHRLGIPLIRCAFPIHDYVGGQRVRTLGFEGSLNLLDQAVNALLEATEKSFRGRLFETYFNRGENSASKDDGAEAPAGNGRKRFAVATKNGAVVDTHFGHAEEVHIYDSDGEASSFVEIRKVGKYCGGPGCEDKEDVWSATLKAVSDCDGVIALRIGLAPESRLRENGIDVITTFERVETAVVTAAKKGVL
jgi:predicted Fe-Mo cluster-binding NifX family protein